MNKKTYTYLFIVGTFFLVLIFPLFNYTVDRWRVLHSDYKHYYAGQSPNKTFLKTKYLIEHPQDAETLLMGSSNGGYIDANLIEKNAYNMKYNFGLLAIHLQNLKTMLKEGVKIKTLWVGINDYIIWKDPKDYVESFERSTYKANFWQDLKTYMFYLFHKPEMMDWYLYQGKYTLLDSRLIINPQPQIEAKKREDEHLKRLEKWSKYMQDIVPTLLHYDDSIYRIDKAISEIEELKVLCERNHIKLVLFMYPVFYKAYLEYNQEKIKEFKRKLAQVIPFHDFYLLNHIAYDAAKWQDSMHFSYSVGNLIVESIKKNIFLVTHENIDKHLTHTIKDIHKDIALLKGIFVVHPSLNFRKKDIIFDLKDKDAVFYKNNDFTLEPELKYFKMIVNGKDPILILDHLHTNAKKVFLTVNIYCDKKTVFKLYYKQNKESNYSEKNTFVRDLNKGTNQLNIVIPAEYINNKLRVNLVINQGNYKINQFTISELE